MTIRRAAVWIERSMPFVAEKSDGLNLSGHAAVFGQETEINSWEGVFLESIRKGAFTKTFSERTPVVQFDHGRHPLVGSLPIASFNDGYPKEDDRGAVINARMVDNWLVSPVRDAIANGTVNGMSFRFEVVRDAWKDNKGKDLTPVEVDNLLWKPGTRGPLHRELIELKVPEMGPVVFPAYQGTDVSVRSAQMAQEIMRDPALSREVRRQIALGVNEIETPEDPAFMNSVARAILFNLPNHESAQLARVREHLQARAVTVADQATLAGLLVRVASAGALLDPISDAICAADDALDAASMVVSEMLGIPNPDPEDSGMTAGMGTGMKSAAPLDEHPVKDAPPVVAPVENTAQYRAAYMRRAYLTRVGVGKFGSHAEVGRES